MISQQELLARTFNQIEDMVFILDMDGFILKVNTAVLSVLGYREADLIGMPIVHVHPVEFQDGIFRNVELMLKEDLTVFQIPLSAASGEHIPVITRIFRSEWDNVHAFVSISQNISAILDTEDRYYRVFNSGQIAMALFDPKSRVFVDINQHFIAIFGYSKEKIVGATLEQFNFLAGTNLELGDISYDNDRESTTNLSIELKTGQGTSLYCMYSAIRISTNPNELLLITFNVITGLMHLEKRLKHNLDQQTLIAGISQELNSGAFYGKLDKLMEKLGIHTGVSRVYIFEDSENSETTSNTFEWCNSGISPQLQELQNIPYNIIPSWKRILEEKGMIFSTNIMELPDDLVKVLEPQSIKSLLVFPILAEQKIIGFIGFDECLKIKAWNQDEMGLLKLISNIISNAFERRWITEREKELNDLKSRFVSNASHEFRTPLAAIMLTSDFLRKYWDKMDKEQIDLRLGKIQERVIYLTHIVNDVLELSKLQEGKAAFNPEQIELVSLCNSLLAEYYSHNVQKGEIRLVQPSSAIFLNADKRLLTSIINNFVSNAVKYSAPKPFVLIEITNDSSELKLTVSDNGIGIPKEEQKHLFEPFFRASNTQVIPGNGLGLNIAKESVSKHGGYISFISTLGQGSCFSIHLPEKMIITKIGNS
jgi:PAS domain S-box-containing protein